MGLPHPAWSRLYRAHFGHVTRWVRLVGVPVRDVEAVAQDVFADVHSALHRYDPSKPFLAWLRAIAARRALDYLRSARHQREAPADLGEDMAPADTRSDPEHHTRLVDAQRILIELLGELGDDLRAVFVMHEVEQLTIPEIAEALGINENTVRSRLHRARRAFDEAHARRGGRLGEMPAVAPLSLLSAGRAPFEDLDPAMAARIWSRLTRLLGLGIVGALATLPAGKVAAGAALLFVLGGAAGATLTHVLEPTAAPPRPASPGVLAPIPLAAAPADVGLDVTANAAPAPTSASTADIGDAGAHDGRDTLRQEQAHLDRAWALFHDGDLAGALRELRKHEKRYPDSALAEQRRGLQQEIADHLAARDGGSG